MFHLLPGVAAAALVLPGAAVQVAEASTPRAPQHIPTGFLVFESEHFLGRCSGVTPLSGSAGTPHAASRDKKKWLPSITTFAHKAFKRRAADFSGTWLLKSMTGDVDQVIEASGLPSKHVPTVKSLGYGAGQMMERIHQQGSRLSIRTSFRGAPSEEVVTYTIGGPPSEAADTDEATRCASWADDKKSEILLETPSKTGAQPMQLHRYMEGPLMVTKLTSGDSEAKGFWERFETRIQNVEQPDAKLQEAIETLHKADKQSKFVHGVEHRVHHFFHMFSSSKRHKK